VILAVANPTLRGLRLSPADLVLVPIARAVVRTVPRRRVIVQVATLDVRVLMRVALHDPAKARTQIRAAARRAPADPTVVRVVDGLVLLTPIAILTEVRLIFIATAPRPNSKSLLLPWRSSMLRATSLTLTPRVPTLTARGLLPGLPLISKVTTPMTRSRTLTSRIPPPITTKLTLNTKVPLPITAKLTLNTKVPVPIVTRRPLAAQARRLDPRNFVRVGPAPRLGAAAVRAELMPKASASRRYCHALGSPRVARLRIGFAPAALPSTANLRCSVVEYCRRTNFASTAASFVSVRLAVARRRSSSIAHPAKASRNLTPRRSQRAQTPQPRR
jgi:hypothetical protein